MVKPFKPRSNAKSKAAPLQHPKALTPGQAFNQHEYIVTSLRTRLQAIFGRKTDIQEEHDIREGDKEGLIPHPYLTWTTHLTFRPSNVTQEKINRVSRELEKANKLIRALKQRALDALKDAGYRINEDNPHLPALGHTLDKTPLEEIADENLACKLNGVQECSAWSHMQTPEGRKWMQTPNAPDPNLSLSFPGRPQSGFDPAMAAVVVSLQSGFLDDNVIARQLKRFGKIKPQTRKDA